MKIQEELEKEIMEESIRRNDICFDYEMLSPEEFLLKWDNNEPDLENEK